MSEGFLSRWSRLKRSPETSTVQDKSPDLLAQDGTAIADASGPATGDGTQDAVAQTAGAKTIAADDLPDIALLKPDSDFKPFMQHGVSPDSRNAALKKLWASPNFNVMDGLDTYIDDYGKPDPIEPEFLKSLNQAKSLRLFDDPDEQEQGDKTIMALVDRPTEKTEGEASDMAGDASVAPVEQEGPGQESNGAPSIELLPDQALSDVSLPPPLVREPSALPVSPSLSPIAGAKITPNIAPRIAQPPPEKA